jgi:hypothetical protein
MDGFIPVWFPPSTQCHRVFMSGIELEGIITGVRTLGSTNYMFAPNSYFREMIDF